MRLEFDLNNNVEKPEIILGKRNYDKFGSIVNFDKLTYDYNLMSANSISFTVYKELNNEKERLWDEIKERRLIWLKEFNEWFQIDVVVNDENGITKEITGTSLCEAELSQVLIKSTEINTENDIAREDYVNPTVFYKPSNTKESLLHRLLKDVPNYSIKYVDESLWDIQRTFSIDGTNIYDELNGEIAEEIGCLFLFDSTDRSISVYDLKTNCNHCGYRGDFNDICPECGSTDLDYGYGRDTTIFVDSETLANNISLSGKQDEVKNYIKVSGGDDIINAAIAACNPTGTQYIYSFSDRDRDDMSDSLLNKLDEYAVEYDALTPTYQSIMKDIYDSIDEQLYLESTMMPDIEIASTNAQKELARLTSENLNPIAVQDVSIASLYTANNAVLGMAKCIVNSTVFKIEIVESSFESQTWKGKFRVTNYSDEEDTAENTGYITITINDDYSYYVNQKIKKTINRNDVYLVDMFDSKTDLTVFKEELKKYCLSRLNSFESAYQTIIDVLIESNCSNYSTYGNIYNGLYVPYYKKLIAIQKEISKRSSEIEIVDARLTELEKSRSEITEQLNLQNYLGDELWKELCSFRREDSYENSNYISDGLDNSEILVKAQELFNKAKNEAITASTLQMSLSTTMINLLAIPEFKKLTGMFEGGNWIRIGLDEKIYRLRLIHFKIDFSEIQNIEVEFSDVTQTANGLNDTKSLMNKVASMATNFNYVAHQAEQGSKSFTELDKIRNDGLNTALYNISSSINQEFIIDEHGITGRQWDDILGDYSPEQVKINNNILVYTDDYWQTAKAAIGKIEYYNPIRKTNISQYGLLADAVISGILIGDNIIGGNIYSENYSSTTGTHIDLNNGDFTFAGGKFVYDSNLNTLNLNGIITSTEGKIGGWSLSPSAIYRNDSKFGSADGMYFGVNGLSINDNFKVTSKGYVTANGAFATDSSGTYAKLSDNSLIFYIDNTMHSKFSTTHWKGTDIYGTAVNSDAPSKFISFGNKLSSSDPTYSTNFLINYGLDPGGITDSVISFGSFLSKGKITTDSSYNLNDENGINMSSGRVNAWDNTAWGINNSKTGSGLYVFGNIGCSGTKERIIQTEHYGAVELNAYETATPYFGDIGSGQCDENGLCYIYIDDIFKQVILTNCDYYVFLQQYGESSVYPIEKNEDYFIVKGLPYQKFDFEIKCRQIGTENMRLNRAGDKIESEECYE